MILAQALLALSHRHLTGRDHSLPLRGERGARAQLAALKAVGRAGGEEHVSREPGRET